MLIFFIKDEKWFQNIFCQNSYTVKMHHKAQFTQLHYHIMCPGQEAMSLGNKSEPPKFLSLSRARMIQNKHTPAPHLLFASIPKHPINLSNNHYHQGKFIYPKWSIMESDIVKWWNKMNSTNITPSWIIQSKKKQSWKQLWWWW